MIPFAGIIRQGDTGTQPVAVKRGLYHSGFRDGWADLDGPTIAAEVFGSLAVANLQTFQSYHGLDVDGVYGPKSHAILQGSFDRYAEFLYRTPVETVQLPFPYRGTHHTSGMVPPWPGLDAIDVFAAAGTRVLAPLAGTLTATHKITWNKGKRVGGWTTYLEAEEGLFFLTHFGYVRPSGTKVERGAPFGTVGEVPNGWWESHIHMGFKAAV